MGKINCNDGCLDNYNAGCVKYTGAPIPIPNIPQNTDFNTILNILVNAINSGAVQVSPDAGNIIELRPNGLYATGGGGGSSCMPVCMVIETSNSYQSGDYIANVTNRFYNGATLIYAIDSLDDPILKYFFAPLAYTTVTYSPSIEIINTGVFGAMGPISLVIYSNDEIIYARTMDSIVGPIVFPSIPPIPVGHIKVMVASIVLDTNDGGEGIFAITGDPVVDSSFSFSYIQDGGSVTIPDGGTDIPPYGAGFIWKIGSSATTFGFEQSSFGNNATQASIILTGVNNETGSILAELISSTNDPTINTSQTVLPGSPVNINVVIDATQIINNDFMIKITKL